MKDSAGRQLLTALKASTRAQTPSLSLAVGNPVEAILRPIATGDGALNPDDVRVLTEWRNRFVTAFLTEFKATETRTAAWLTEVVANDETRILFMVDDVNGKTIGYMGLAFIDWKNGSGEADAIVRGGEAPPGLMSRAMRTMLNWAHGQLGLTTLGVRVRSDNRALEFYRKFGFEEVRRNTLRRTEEPGGIRWIEDDALPPAEPSLVHMVLKNQPARPQK